MASTALQRHQKDFIDSAMAAGALKFGSFVLKSGRCVVIVCGII